MSDTYVPVARRPLKYGPTRVPAVLGQEAASAAGAFSSSRLGAWAPGGPVEARGTRTLPLVPQFPPAEVPAAAYRSIYEFDALHELGLACARPLDGVEIAFVQWRGPTEALRGTLAYAEWLAGFGDVIKVEMALGSAQSIAAAYGQSIVEEAARIRYAAACALERLSRGDGVREGPERGEV